MGGIDSRGLKERGRLFGIYQVRKILNRTDSQKSEVKKEKEKEGERKKKKKAHKVKKLGNGNHMLSEVATKMGRHEI